MGKITNRRKILAIIIVSLLFLPVSNCAIREPEKPDKPISQIQVGESWHTIDSDQKMRRYLLYMPASYDGNTPAPLVLNFHGSGSNPSGQLVYSDFKKLAEEKGFIAVFPFGQYKSRGMNRLIWDFFEAHPLP